MSIVFKFNSGKGAILCNNCGTIVASGGEIYDYIKNPLEEMPDIEVFCSQLCRDEYYNNRKEKSLIIK